MSTQEDVEQESPQSMRVHATEDSAASASWHPALRPDVGRAADNDDDFFERYPNATPKKAQQQREQAQTQNAKQAQPESIAEPVLHTEAADEPEEGLHDMEDRQRTNSISVEHVLAIHHSAASPEDLSQGPSSTANASGPIERHEHAEEEDVDAVTPAARNTAEDDEDMLFKSQDETVEEQRQDLENALPAHEDNLAEVDEEPIVHPESGYDYQGEVTEMEAAQDGEPDAPLLDDEQPPPTISRSAGTDLSLGGVMERDGEAEVSPTLVPAAKAVTSLPQIDRSFTTNFTEVPVSGDGREEARPESQEAWPGDGGGDDRTFGELLGDRQEEGVEVEVEERDSGARWPAEEEEDPFEKLGGAVLESAARAPFAQDPLDQEVDDLAAPDGTIDSRDAAAQEGGPVDLAAAWEAALDDDELLDLDESEDLDPAKLFGEEDEDGLLEDDDGDDFLADLNASSQSAPQQQPPQSRLTSSQYQPVQRQAQNPYASSPAASQSPFLQNHGRGAGTPETGLFDIYNTQPQQQSGQAAQQRPPLNSAQSFADKSKGGYQSPYDLPMEVVKPARRRAQPPPTSGSVAPVPPPRSSSFGSTSASASHPAPPSGPGGAGAGMMSPPGSRAGPPSSSGSTTGPAGPAPSSAKSTPKTDSGFFADLPMSTKPRARPSGGYTPAGSVPGTPGMSGGAQFPPGPPSRAGSGYLPQTHPSRGAGQPPQQPQEQAGYAGLGLRQPEKMPLLPDQPSAPAAAPIQSQGTVNNRYSPAPPPTAQAAPSSRYSPAPAAQPGPQSGAPAGSRATSGPPPTAAAPPRIPSVNQYAPRTSSPLAFANEKNLPALPNEGRAGMSPPKVNGMGGGSRYSPAATTSQDQGISGLGGMVMPPPSSLSQRGPAAPPTSQQQPPPMRPRTQSPVSTMKDPRSLNALGMGITPLERPTSAAGAAYTHAATAPNCGQLGQHRPQPQQQQQSGIKGPTTVLPHRRQFSRDLAFHPPSNTTAQDPLERWKGGPIFHWTGAGSVLTSFPSRTPFYGGGRGGASGPVLKCTSGEIKVRDAAAVGVASVLVDDAGAAKFPGPLAAKAKGRKKEVLAWMGARIEGLEAQAQAAKFAPRVPGDGGEDVPRCAEERVLLWRVLRVFVEFDGVVEGSKKVEEEVRAILVPDLEARGRVAELASPVSAGGSSALVAEPVDRVVLAQIRQALLEGQRERAVWLAEEKKLWGHAMLLASTLGPETWRQVVQGFVRAQVLAAAGGTVEARSLAAAYQVFAGNGEEVVDALVPASARAGFRMVSASDGSVGSSSPLEGLEQWRETLGLVVGNRTPGDGESVARLGRLLASYGRAEAAGVCWLIGRGFVKVGGADEGESDFVLLGGVGHKESLDGDGAGNKAPVGADLDAILLTEIYEWACSLSSATNPTTVAAGTPYLPHLQPYKLIHAQLLAASGHKSQAQAYCDHITTAYSSTTRPSQHYHPGFTQAVADLQAFLSQTPAGAEGGKGFLGLSRPGMKSVGSGVGTWFSKFVAGEEDNAAAPGQGQGVEGMMMSPDQAASGPFGRVSGEVSRSASRNDFFGPMLAGGMSAPASVMGGVMGQQSPYVPGVQSAVSTPGGRYAPSSGTYGGSAPVAVPQRSVPAGQTSAANSPYAPSFGSPAAGSGLGMSPMEHGNHVFSPLASPPSTSHSLGVPAPSDHYARPGSAPRASSRSRYAPSPVQHGLGVQGAAAPGLNRAASDYGVPYGSDSRRGSAQEIGSQGSYQPSPIMAAQQDMPGYGYNAVQQPEPEQLDTQQETAEDDAFGPKVNGLGFDPEAADPSETAGGYEPPNASAAYEPPSYQPYEPEPETEADDELRPKKKGMMDLDDDEDMAARAAALKKAAADREADEAFRKAAEADAARDSKSGKDAGKAAGGGGWFKGGWFGGKKDAAGDLNAANPNKPIRAKLGEESSFYYDETLKKWVNKKGGAEAATPAAATPPPPKGMSRNVSGVTGPPSGPPSRVASAAGSMGPPSMMGSRPGTSSGLPPSAMGMAMSNGGSGPPSRAGTPASGAAEAMNGEGVASPPIGIPPPMRPASSMSTASSLDDLLAAGPRKGGPGGTVKGKKKGRYVDVMAK